MTTTAASHSNFRTLSDFLMSRVLARRNPGGHLLFAIISDATIDWARVLEAVRDHPLVQPGAEGGKAEVADSMVGEVARVRLGNAGLVHDGMVEEAVEPGGTAGGKESPDASAARKHAPLEPLPLWRTKDA